MCGRYYVEPESSSELLELIAEAKRKSDEVKTGEVFPSDTAAVIANNRQLKPAVFPMRWGFERKGDGLVINARSETASEKQLFRESAQLRRCLIPASCYFEWERRADGKVKYAIRPKGKELLYLGGLYTKPEPGALPRFTILTRDLGHSHLRLLQLLRQGAAFLARGLYTACTAAWPAKTPRPPCVGHRRTRR